MQDLGRLPGHAMADGFAVSGDGSVIVGQSYAYTPYVVRAVMWRADVGLVDLNDYLGAQGVDLTGWTLKLASGVSADGRTILGNGDYNGQNRAWIVTGLGACYANCDGSTAPPVLNANDFQCFVNLFATGDAGANCDGSTAAPILNVNDFQCFVNRFAAGCG
jgi:hypothetical protein